MPNFLEVQNKAYKDSAENLERGKIEIEKHKVRIEKKKGKEVLGPRSNPYDFSALALYNDPEIYRDRLQYQKDHH